MGHCLRSPGLTTIGSMALNRLDSSTPTVSGSLTCLATCGSGAGTMSIPLAMRIIERCGAAVGRINTGASGHRSDGAACQGHNWTMLDFALHKVRWVTPTTAQPKDGPIMLICNGAIFSGSRSSDGPLFDHQNESARFSALR